MSDEYHFWTPRFWHGMSLPAWLRLLHRNRYRVSPSRFYMAGSITLLAGLNSIGGMLDHLFAGHQIQQTTLSTPPLFVLGHWRSGTTLLHELLIRDPEHTFPTTFQCFAPQLCTLFEPHVVPWTGWLLPNRRPMDNVETGWERPQEDEFALCNVGVPSPYLEWAFPNHGPVDTDYLTLQNLTPEEREVWKRQLVDFVKRVAAKRNVRVVLKSPPHTARLRTIREAFPDAKFVHITRDPRTLYPSTLKLWHSLSDTQGLQRPIPSPAWRQDSVLDNLSQMYQAFHLDRRDVPPENLVDVRYEDLIADTLGELRRVYTQLGLGDFERPKPQLEEYLNQQADYKTNLYEHSPETEAMLREHWGEYFTTYGYD